MRMVVIAALVLLPLAACQSKAEKQGMAAEATGSGVTRSYAASGFSKVDLRGSDDVDVKIGAFSVTAEGDPKVLDQLDIRVVDGTLRIGRKQDGWSSDDGATIHVVMPSVTGASLAGSGDLSIAGLRGDAVDFSLAGSGDLRVAGSTGKLKVAIAGSGEVKAEGLTARSADISIAGSGGVTGVVKGPASVSLVGSGDVELTGGAQCSVNSIGSGEAHCS
jgi:hypothetical protein